MLATPIERLRTIGLIESLSSFALFFVAMPIKYIDALGGNPQPVSIVGAIHGGLFCIYILALILAIRSPGLPKPITGLALLASLLPFPFGWLVLDPKLKRIEAEA
jgi:integral membrane protein